MASVGGLAPSESGVMHLEGDITSFVGCKTTILPNLQAPSAPGNPLSRRRGALAPEGSISIGRGLWPPWPPTLDPRLYQGPAVNIRVRPNGPMVNTVNYQTRGNNRSVCCYVSTPLQGCADICW